MKIFIYLLAIAIILMGVRSITKNIYKNQPAYRQQTEKNQKSERFVHLKAKDDSLYFNDKLFRSIGVNRYNLLSYNQQVHCASSFTEEEINKLFFELKEIGITSIRFWMFQSFTDQGNDLSRFDYVLDKAREYNIFLIPVFENHWADCTEGGVKEDEWYESGYLNPYDDYSLSLKDYIKKIIPIYKDNPRILAWQIMNEAESENEEVLYDFAEDLSRLIRSSDKNHLISIGVSRNYKTNKFYRNLHSIKTVDLLEYHDYHNLDQQMPRELRKGLEDADFLKKPLIVGETGTYQDDEDNLKFLDAKIKAYFNAGGSLYMLWSYGGESVTDDGHNFDNSDPLAYIIKSAVAKLSK